MDCLLSVGVIFMFMIGILIWVFGERVDFMRLIFTVKVLIFGVLARIWSVLLDVGKSCFFDV